jgi:hypothetical protein
MDEPTKLIPHMCHESRFFLCEKYHIVFVEYVFKGFDSMWVSKLEIATKHPLVNQVKKIPKLQFSTN